ncbi:F0F1 ATP synthase subunit delta [Patescibacteria group bacterium]|nr:F0F1 ATP synthase subunit delta [Patescibacteria group bacterium]
MKRISNPSTVVTKSLVTYLSEKGEMELLPEVTKSLADMAAKLGRPEEILVRSAVSLTPREKTQIAASMKRRFGITVPIRTVTDAALLGGFTIQVGDWVLDASFSHALRTVEQALLAA